jgi:hypothetical protein|tara:strand:- start:593 stop:2491 length:1899 start_codon:yes stop_codon:yes gene_type:complete
MHIIFGFISFWQVPLLKVLRYFKPNVYYLYIDAKTDIKKNEIATKLKKSNIFPLPIEFEKKISTKASYSLCETDPDEIAYKKNIKLVSDTILIKYCNLFSINEKKLKKLRLLIQDFIFFQQMKISGKLGIWSALYPEKKIIYISFKFKCFYNTDIGQNIFKVVLPLDIVKYLTKIIPLAILKLFSVFKIKNNQLQKKKVFNGKDLNELAKKAVAFIPHKGLAYGTKDNILYEKSLYYSDNKDSYFNKYNILHLDYSNFPSPDKNIYWICLNKMKTSNAKFFFQTLFASIKTFYLIRGWQTFLVWLLFIHQYNKYVKYCESISKFKNLKIVLLDYDILCPKTLILALEKNNIKTIATQERFIHTFYSSYATVIVDTYFTNSEYTANLIKKSKYYDVKNLIPVGKYRADYLSLFRKKIVPKEISEARQNGKKILVFLGYHSPKYWYDSYVSLFTNWSSQISLLEDVVRFSKCLENTFIIVRYKNLDWPLKTENCFKDILNKINNCKNIIISENYKESLYSYKLCANADLVIAKHTSIADECLSNEIPVLFYDYAHNTRRVTSDVFNYLSSGLMCCDFEELLEKSKSLLFNSSSKLKNDINKLNKTIYYVKEKQDVKKKILMNLENYLIKNNISI